MDPVVALRDALHLLGGTSDLADGLDTLLADLVRAAPSAVGLEVRVVAVGQDVLLGRFVEGTGPYDVGASLRVPLGPDGDVRAHGPDSVSVTFYATRPGAFVDLGADLALVGGLALDRVDLDGHRPTSTRSGVRGLEQVSAVQRAVGVLIDRGIPPDQAYDRLAEEARTCSAAVADHARSVVAEAVRLAGGSQPAASTRGGTE